MKIFLLLLIGSFWRGGEARTTFGRSQQWDPYMSEESFSPEDILSKTLSTPFSITDSLRSSQNVNENNFLDDPSALIFGDNVIKIRSSLHSDEDEKFHLKQPGKKFHHVIEIVPKENFESFKQDSSNQDTEELNQIDESSDFNEPLNGDYKMFDAEIPKSESSKHGSAGQVMEELDETFISPQQQPTDFSTISDEIEQHPNTPASAIELEFFAGGDEGSGEEMLGSNDSEDKSGRLFGFFSHQASRRNDSAPECTTPQNESGHCRPFRHCLLSNALNNYNVFLQYLCLIRGIRVGICCADNPVINEIITPDENETISEQKAEIKQPPEGCGLNVKHRIVGGTISAPNEWSWMVALMRRGRFFCGGVIINNWYVLTAAHCVMGINIRDISIRLGEYNFDTKNGNEHDLSVAEIKRHAQFVTLTFQHDIALLKLRRSIQYSKFVGSICLPTDKEKNYADVKGTVVGWGTVSFGGAASPILRQVTIPIWKNEDCDRTYRMETIDDSFMCAGSPEKGEDACQGDSGGPLMTLNERGRWEVIGIVSWGRRCGDPTFPGVYARVTSYIDWIKQNVT